LIQIKDLKTAVKTTRRKTGNDIKVGTVTEKVTNDCQNYRSKEINSKIVWPISIKDVTIYKKGGKKKKGFTEISHQDYCKNPHKKTL
jgi:hypothetical protein